MHNRHGQSGFHFRILDLKASKQEYSFIFSAHIFAAKKEIVSVPEFTVLGNLLEKLFCVLRLYDFENFPYNCWRKPLNMFIYFYCQSLDISVVHWERSDFIQNLLKCWFIIRINNSKCFFRLRYWFYCLGVASETSRLKSNNILEKFS